MATSPPPPSTEADATLDVVDMVRRDVMAMVLKLKAEWRREMRDEWK